MGSRYMMDKKPDSEKLKAAPPGFAAFLSGLRVGHVYDSSTLFAAYLHSNPESRNGSSAECKNTVRGIMNYAEQQGIVRRLEK